MAGGSTGFSGIAERLQKELQLLADRHVAADPAEASAGQWHYNVIAPPGREWTVFVGGSLLVARDSRQHRWVTKEEYQEGGSSVVSRK